MVLIFIFFLALKFCRMLCCCNQFDPSFGHNAEGSDGECLKEAGKQLRSGRPVEVDNACRTIISIFTQNSPFCPISVGLRRTCILFLNWLQGLGTLTTSEWTEAGQLLIVQIGRTEPRLARIYFDECLEVVRVFQDMVSLNGKIEVFPRFVAASKSVILGRPAAEDDRGVVVSVVPGIVDILWLTLERLVQKFSSDIFLNESNVGKLGMCLIASSSRLGNFAFVPTYLADAHIDLYAQLDDEPEIETQMIDDGEVCIIMPSIAGILDQIKTQVTKAEAGTRVNAAISSISVDLLLTQITSRGNGSILSAFQKSTKSSIFDFRKEWLLLSIRNSILREFSSWSDKRVVGHVVGYLCSTKDFEGLSILSSLVSSTVPELVVSYLHYPMLIHVLSTLSSQGGFSEIAPFVTAQILNNKYPLNQLIEANGSELVVTAIEYLIETFSSTQSEKWVKEASRIVRQIIAVVAGAGSVQQQVKKLKVQSSNSENPSWIFLIETYLHLIQLIENHHPAALALLIESVGEEITRSFLTRTVETVTKLTDIFRSNEFEGVKLLWKVFASKIGQDDRVMPVLLEASKEFEFPLPTGRQEALHSLYEELGKERTVSCKIALIKNASLTDFEESSPKLLHSLCDLVRMNLDDSKVLEAVTDFVSRVGPLLLVSGKEGSSEVAAESSSEYIAVTTKEGWDLFVVQLVRQFLIPELRQSSHGYAVQEILKCVGRSIFSQETIVAISPYLTSSYRVHADSPQDDNAAITSIEDLFIWCQSRISKEPTRSLMKALIPATSRDLGLVSWVLPYSIELLGSEVTSSEEEVVKITEGFKNILSRRNNTDVDKVQVNAIFSTIDHLRRVILSLSTSVGRKSGSRAEQFYVGLRSVGGPEYVKASLLVEDYSRALQYQEQLMSEETEIHLLATIYEKLGIKSGVIGATSLGSSTRLSEMELAARGKFNDIILRHEQVPENSGQDEYMNVLVDSGHYRSAIAQGSKSLSEKVSEAVWRLGDWESKTEIKGDGFDSAFARLLTSQHKSEISLDLMKKLSLNIDNGGDDLVGQLFLLRSIADSDRGAIEELRNLIPKVSSVRCREVLLEGAVAIARAFKEKEAETAFQTGLLKHYRRSGNEGRVKQLLPLVKNDAAEWAKSAWYIGERNEALKCLTQSGSGSFKSRLLHLKYSAELERSVPKLVIRGYRELMKQAVSKKEKGDVSFSFGEYLDKVGSEALSSDNGVWNRTLLVQELSSNLLVALIFYTNTKRVLFSLNRIFQIHWELFHSGETGQVKLAAEIVTLIQSLWKQIPCWVWYIALPQLLVRAGAGQLGSVCEDIIVSVLSEYPRQASWMVLPGLLNSKSGDRRTIAGRILQRVVETSDYPNIQQLVGVVRSISESLVALARFDGNIKSLAETKEGTRLMRNTGGLLVVPTKNQISPSSVLSAMERSRAPFSDEIRISKFCDSVYVYNTKAKPKRISVVDSEGRTVMFILKVEKKTDLRKDARMMDFINVVNTELQQGMRTYQVLTLSEDTGLIEFIPNLTTIRKIIDESLVKVGKSVSLYLNKDVMNKLAHKTEGFPYYKSIVDTIPPMLGEFFSKQFPTPRLWLNARNKFTISQAYWCLSGWVVGLGDRHPDNLLIALDSGELVHVDFDCIFSRGMVLTIPELVPFRLTPICVSGMGVTGVEGLFRASCEEIMKLVRERKKMLLSVLHAFIADPLIDWQGGSTSFKKARDVISAIERKLNGFVDVGEIRPDSCEEKLIAFTEGSEKNSGLGKDRGAALSVEGQVDELLRAAVCQRNLAKMYLGWMPMF